MFEGKRDNIRLGMWKLEYAPTSKCTSKLTMTWKLELYSGLRGVLMESGGVGGEGGGGGLNLETVAKSQELNIKQPYSQHLGSYFRWTPTSWAFRTFILRSSGYMELDQDQSDATLHATEM